MRNISRITAVAVLAISALAVAAYSVQTMPSSSASMYPSDSERRVEQCMSSGGIEETCIYEEMKRTMLVDQS